jgi:LysR family cyn operon transcriptional activator
MLSHDLQQLEDELGPQRFERLGRGLKLSQAGAECRVYTSRALKKIEVGQGAFAASVCIQSHSPRDV